MENWERVDISPEDIKKALKFPDNFGMSSDDERYDEIVNEKTWSLGIVVKTRDSNLLELSNHKALMEYLKGFEDIQEDWKITGCNHWAVGWVEHLSFKVFNESSGEIAKRTPSKAFKVIKAWFDGLSDYGIADENDLCDREYKASLENIEQEAKSIGRRTESELKENLPENWVAQCYTWLSDHNHVETDYESGYYPKQKHLLECLEALEFVVDTSEE